MPQVISGVGGECLYIGWTPPPESTRTHAPAHLRARADSHPHTCADTDTQTHIDAHLQTHTRAHAHTHTHIHAHAYMRTHARRQHTRTRSCGRQRLFASEPFGRATHSAAERAAAAPRSPRSACGCIRGHRCVVAHRPMAHPTSAPGPMPHCAGTAPGLVMLSGATVVQTPREALRRTELREREGRNGAERDTPYRWFGCATITHAPMHTSRLRPLSVEMAEALIAHLGALSKLSECCLAFSPFPVYSPTRPPARTAQKETRARASVSFLCVRHIRATRA